MRNPVDPDHPQVILPFKYLDEIKRAPQNRLSFGLFSRQAFLLNYINGPEQTDAAAHVVRTDLNKNLGSLTKGMHGQCASALSDRIPKCDGENYSQDKFHSLTSEADWTPLQPYFTIAYVIARISALAFVGPELCRDEEWIKMTVDTTLITMRTAQTVRQKYSPHWRWLAPFLDEGSKAAHANRKRAAELLEPIYQKRLTQTSDPEKSVDSIQWLINAARGRTKSMEELADEQLFLSIGSIHSTAASALSTLYDLLDRPAYMDDILQEIHTVRAQNESSEWTHRSLEKLEKLDSFMKESQRFNPVGLGKLPRTTREMLTPYLTKPPVTMQRSAVKPYTFKDGLRIPANTQCCFPNYELNHDADVYPDPQTFDGYRFLRLRQTVDSNKFHFAYVSDQSINFGAGTHSCPGRHFASNEIKILLAELLQGYEVKWPEGKSRPPNMAHDVSRTPNPMVDIMFRTRNA